MTTPVPFVCPVCERACPASEASRHHVLPKSRGGRTIVILCRNCHRQIHALFSVKDLARRHNTVDKLKATPEMQKWIRWISRKPLFAILFLLAFCGNSRLPAQVPTDNGDRLEQQVSVALIQDQRAGNVMAEEALVKKEGSAILPYYNKRIFDSSDWVRLDVLSAAESFDTPLAFQMLVTLINDPDSDIGDKAEMELDRLFPISRIRQLAGPSLKRNLLSRIANNQYRMETILLLSCSPSYGKHVPQDVKDALNSLLLPHSPSGISQSQSLPPPRRVAAINVTLSVLGQKSAHDHLLRVINNGSVDDVLPLLDSDILAHITDKSLLVPMVELLHDKRETEFPRRNIMADDPRKPTPHLGNFRVCDIALLSLGEKANIDQTEIYKVLHKRPFTDVELLEGYIQVNTYFQNGR